MDNERCEILVRDKDLGCNIRYIRRVLVPMSGKLFAMFQGKPYEVIQKPWGFVMEV